MKIRQNKQQKNKLKKFFNNNAVRAAIVFFLVFMAIPFFFTEPTREVEEEDQFSSAPVVISQNPLSKIFDRVARFYGIKKSAPGARTFADLIGLGADIYGPGGGLQTSARADAPAQGAAAGGQSGFASYTGEGQGRVPGRSRQAEAVQEFVRMDGKTYEVKADASGKKVVMMENGPVSFNKLMAQTVSREDYRAAKKAAPHLQSWQLAEAIHYAQQNNWPGGAPAFLRSDEYRRFTESGSPSLFADAGGTGGWGGSGSGGSAAAGGTVAGSGGKGGRASTFGSKLAAAKAAEIKAAAAASALKAGPIVPTEVAEKRMAGLEVTKVMGEMEQGYKSDFKDLNSAVAAENIVDVNLEESANRVMPANKDFRKGMTEALLGKGRVFEGEMVDEKGNVIKIRDPWGFPVLTAEEADTPAWSFYNANKAALLFSDIKEYKKAITWSDVDSANTKIKEKLFVSNDNENREPKGAISLWVPDGGSDEKKNYYYQFLYNFVKDAPGDVEVRRAVIDKTTGKPEKGQVVISIMFDPETNVEEWQGANVFPAIVTKQTTEAFTELGPDIKKAVQSAMHALNWGTAGLPDASSNTAAEKNAAAVQGKIDETVEKVNRIR